MACGGVQMIGSPMMLNDVFNTHGTPVMFSNSLMTCHYSGLVFLLTVCGRAVPSTWVMAGTFFFLSSLTCVMNNMYGLSVMCSKYSAEFSSNTDGANGRKSSRCLTHLLTMSRISTRVGSASKLRLPSARGPHSPALIPCDDFAVGDEARDFLGRIVHLPVIQFRIVERRQNLAVAVRRPQKRVVHHVAARRAVELVVNVHGCPDCTASIAGVGRDENAVE
jgi:hypothetical protein